MGSKTLKLQSIQQPEPTMTNAEMETRLALALAEIETLERDLAQIRRQNIGIDEADESKHETKEPHFFDQEIINRRELFEIESKHLEQKNKIFSNQETTAQKIMNLLSLDTILITLWGLTQSGKTGVINAVSKLWLKSDANFDPKNIYFFMSLSDTSLFSQWKKRTPTSVHKNMAKSVGIKKIISSIRGKKNVLIFIDECHYGAKTKSVLGKAFKDAGLKDLDYLVTNNIKIVQVSATPDGVLIDSLRWGEHHKKVFHSPGANYIGFEKLKSRGQIKEYTFLKTLIDICALISSIRSFSTARYHLIRAPSVRKDGAYENLKRELNVWCKSEGWNFEEENSKIRTERKNRGAKVESLLNDSYLNTHPATHTIILIKGDLTAGKTLIKKHLGVIYDRKTGTVNDSFLIQGLAGRVCGYPDNDKLPEDAILFTNCNTINKYIDLSNGKQVPWRSTTTKPIKGFKTKSLGTHQHHENIKNLEPILDVETDRNQAPQTGKYVNLSPILDLMEKTTEGYKLVYDAQDYLTDVRKNLGQDVPTNDVVDWLVAHPRERNDPKTKKSAADNYRAQFCQQMFKRSDLQRTDDGTTKGLLLFQEGGKFSNWFFRLND